MLLDIVISSDEMVLNENALKRMKLHFRPDTSAHRLQREAV